MRVLQAKTKRPLDLLAIGAGGHIAAASSVFGVRGDVDVWEITSGRHIFIYWASVQELKSLAFLPDGQHIVMGKFGSVSFVHGTTKSVQDGAAFGRGFAEAAVASTVPKLVVLAELDPGSRLIFDVVQPDFSLRNVWSEGLEWSQAFHSPAINTDGTRVAIVQRSSAAPRQLLTIRDSQDGRVLANFSVDAADPVRQLSFASDGMKLLARTDGRSVKVFDVATGQAAGELLHTGRPYVSGMAVHPNGTIACSRNNGTVCLWNLETRELVRTLDWKLGKLVSVAFSPDGNIGAAGTEDGQVVVWDVDE